MRFSVIVAAILPALALAMPDPLPQGYSGPVRILLIHYQFAEEHSYSTRLLRIILTLFSSSAPSVTVVSTTSTAEEGATSVLDGHPPTQLCERVAHAPPVKRYIQRCLACKCTAAPLSIRRRTDRDVSFAL